MIRRKSPFALAALVVFAAMSVASGAASAVGTASWRAPVRIDTNSRQVVGVSCAGSRFCMAFDTGNDQLTFDGSSWATGPVIDSLGVVSLSCASPMSRVEGDIQGFVRRYNGRTWSARVDLSSQFNPIGGYLDAVSCPSASFCMAGDHSGHTYISTDGGRVWSSPVASGLYDVAQLSCASAVLCASSDIYGNLAVFDGTGWGAPQADVGAAPKCVASTCFAVGTTDPDTIE